MTVFTDNIIFLVSGVQRLSHSGDTISISRNLTIASPSTFVSAVPITFSTSNASANLIQTIQPSDLATNPLGVRAQDAYAGAVTNVLGGNLTLSSGLGTTAGNSGSVNIQTGGTTRLSVSPTNVTIPGIVSAAYLKTDGSGNITAGTSLAITNIAPGTSGQVLMSNATPATTWTTFSGDVTVSATGATTVNSISGSSPIAITPSTLQWLSTTATPTINQAQRVNSSVSGTTGAALSITGQSGQNTVGTATQTGGLGALVTISGGAGGNATGAGTSNTGGTGGNVTITAGAAGTASGATTNTPGSIGTVGIYGSLINLGVSNSNYIAITAAFTSSITFTTNAGGGANINYTPQSSTSAGSGATGWNIGVTAQAGQAATGAGNNGGTGGNVVLGGGTGGTSGSASAGVAGQVIIQQAGNNLAMFGSNVNSTNGDSMTTPNNFTWNGSGTVGIRSVGAMTLATGGSALNISTALGTNFLSFTPATAFTSVYGNTITSSVATTQTALASGASAGTTTTGVPMSITAQAGQANSTNSGTGGTGGALTVSAGAGGAETGTTSTGGVGGNLVLTSGVGGTGTTAGAAGNVNIQAGGTTIASATPNQFQLTKGFQTGVTIIAANTASYTVLPTDYVVSISANTTTGITITLPSSPSKGDTYIIKDSGGTSFTWNITVDSGSGNLIDGSRTYTVATNYASLTLVWINSTTKWSVL